MAKHRKSKLAVAVTAAAVPVLTIGAVSLVTAYLIRKNFGRGTYPERKRSTKYWYDPDYIRKHPRLNVEFHSGENILQGYIYGLENENPKALLVFSHGITVGHEMYINSLMWFVEQGYLVFAYDATGSCTSEGSGTVGLVQSALDLHNALLFAEQCERFEGLPVFLLGHSWGGYAVAAVQNFDHNIQAAISVSGYADPVEMLELGAELNTRMPNFAKAMTPFIWGYNKATFGEYSSLNAVDGINRSGIPNLIVHGELDDYVDFYRASIFSKQESITNPNAEFYAVSSPYANHENLWRGDEGNAYMLNFRQKLAELAEAYHGDELEEQLDKLYAQADRELTNQVNLEMLQRFDQFYQKNLPTE